MKTKWMMLFVLTSGIATGALAQDSNSARTCSSQNSKFLQVARDYSNCNSITGSDQQACSRFCEDSDRMLRESTGPVGGSCSADQIQRYQAEARMQGVQQGRQEGRNEVIRDLSVREDFVSSDFYGINEVDCHQRASANSQRLRIEAIHRCNSKAVSIKNCYVESETTKGTFGRPPLFEARANFKRDDNKSTQEECQNSVIAQATQEALRNCLNATGSTCVINPAHTTLNHRIEKPSGPRFGRRDERICDARIVAEAPRDLSFKCNVRISARNQVSPQ